MTNDPSTLDRILCLTHAYACTQGPAHTAEEGWGKKLRAGRWRECHDLVWCRSHIAAETRSTRRLWIPARGWTTGGPTSAEERRVLRGFWAGVMLSNGMVTGRLGRKKRFRGKRKEILEGNVCNIIIAHLLYVCDCQNIKIKNQFLPQRPHSSIQQLRGAPAYRGAIVTSSLPSDPHGSHWAMAMWWERQMAKV